jgi:glutamate racemase
MKDQPVLFMDSGIGGIPSCHCFCQRTPGENVVYLADRLHCPYGGREREEIASILISLVERVIQVANPQIAVLACNTATVSALAELRERFPSLPFVGTVPAVKPAALGSMAGRIGVLGTERTIREPYIEELMSRYGSYKGHGIAAPELVEFIERRCHSVSPERKRELARGYLNRFRAAGVDALVLGCTHFLFLLEEFREEGAPDIAVFDSVKGVTRRVESLLTALAGSDAAGNSPVPNATVQAPQNRLLLTGTAEPEPSWSGWAARLGFSLSLL